MIDQVPFHELNFKIYISHPLSRHLSFMNNLFLISLSKTKQSMCLHVRWKGGRLSCDGPKVVLELCRVGGIPQGRSVPAQGIGDQAWWARHPYGEATQMLSEPRVGRAQSCREWPEAHFGFLGQGEKGDDTGVWMIVLEAKYADSWQQWVIDCIKEDQ